MATPTAGHLPKTVLALDHVQVPPRLLIANHGRRYVFSQPILDRICICNASHLEHSRPGAQGRRVTHQQWTRQPGTVKTPPSPQSRSSSKKFTFPSPPKERSASPTSPNRQGLRVPSPCQLVVTNSLPGTIRTLFHFFSLFLSPLGFQPFPPVPATPSPCTTLTFSKSDLTNLSHQPGNPTLPQPTVKVVLASHPTQPVPTVVAQKTLLGVAMVVEMLHDARAAAEALLEGTRNEAGECGGYCPSLAYSRESSSRGSSPGGQNPGNNLHVSSLSHRVDSRDLENHFAAIGRVSHRSLSCVERPVTNTTTRFRRLKSCAIPTPMNHADSVS